MVARDSKAAPAATHPHQGSRSVRLNDADEPGVAAQGLDGAMADVLGIADLAESALRLVDSDSENGAEHSAALRTILNDIGERTTGIYSALELVGPPDMSPAQPIGTTERLGLERLDTTPQQLAAMAYDRSMLACDIETAEMDARHAEEMALDLDQHHEEHHFAAVLALVQKARGRLQAMYVRVAGRSLCPADEQR